MSKERSDSIPVKTWELQFVRYCARLARSRGGSALAIAVSKLGNGWLYPPLAVALVAAAGARAWPAVLVGGTSIAVGQGILFVLKRSCCRSRPCQVAEDLECLLPVQEWNSFPSGHMMTLTTAMASVLPVCPPLAWVAGPLWGLMAWARMACGHHYPSDVLAGTAVGLVVYYLVLALAVGADLV
jgi:membrane-associated phospholipid phosphatase